MRKAVLTAVFLATTQCSSSETVADSRADARSSGRGHTELADGNRLTLTTNVPPLVADCSSPEGTACADADGDSLVDEWEDIVLERFRPVLRLDESEQAASDPRAVLSMLGRVALVSVEPLTVRAFIVIAYSRDYGSCWVTAHDGDSERVAVELVQKPGLGPYSIRLSRAYTAAHEYAANDHSRVFATSELTALRFARELPRHEPRWVVFPSANKHASYASRELCERAPVPCLWERCAPDGVVHAAALDVLPPIANAGEAQTPRISDLGVLGFPGDDAWDDRRFCGGGARGRCSSPIREKLLRDPF